MPSAGGNLNDVAMLGFEFVEKFLCGPNLPFFSRPPGLDGCLPLHRRGRECEANGEVDISKTIAALFAISSLSCGNSAENYASARSRKCYTGTSTQGVALSIKRFRL